jgi:hypothetical protein
MSQNLWILRPSLRTTGALSYQQVLDGVRSVVLTQQLMKTERPPVVIIPISGSMSAMLAVLKGTRFKSSRFSKE